MIHRSFKRNCNHLPISHWTLVFLWCRYSHRREKRESINHCQLCRQRHSGYLLFYNLINLIVPMVWKLFICFLERYKLIINRCSSDPTYPANMEITHSKCLSLTFINASVYHVWQQSLLQHRVIKEDFLAPYVIHGLETGFVLFYSVNFIIWGWEERGFTKQQLPTQ